MRGRDLLLELGTDQPEPVASLRQAVVAAVNAGPPASVDLTLLGGSDTVIPAVRHLAAYSPTVGDTVWCLQQRTDLLVLGTLA
jgi:hypothetical protein